MAEYASDFDFIEDESGGKFVSVGGPLQQLRTLLARAGLLEEAAVASFDTRKSIAQMFRRARDFAGAARVYELAKRLFTLNLAERVRALSAAR